MQRVRMHLLVVIKHLVLSIETNKKKNRNIQIAYKQNNDKTQTHRDELVHQRLDDRHEIRAVLTSNPRRIESNTTSIVVVIAAPKQRRQLAQRPADHAKDENSRWSDKSRIIRRAQRYHKALLHEPPIAG